jgi:hypothetical protein
MDRLSIESQEKSQPFEEAEVVSTTSPVLTLRTSGFARYFMGALACAFGAATVLGPLAGVAAILKGHYGVYFGIKVGPSEWLSIPLGVILFGWLTYCFAFYLWSNRIVLTDSELAFQFWQRPPNPQSPAAIVPHAAAITLKLTEIEVIFIGPAGLIVRLHDGTKHCITTKPFSKRGCQRLAQSLSERGVVCQPRSG